MKLSEKWLREWVDPAAAVEQLAERLTMAGLEVEGLEQVGMDLATVLVAEVKTVVPHPRADNLKICEVDTGQGKSVNIVCGAPDVQPGMRVALATTGTRLPGGKVIDRGKIRDVMSEGMLCSAAELGLSDDAGGLLEIPRAYPPGQSLADVCYGPDTVLEISLTPNRGDCLSVQGIASELAVLYQSPLQKPVISAVPATGKHQRQVHLHEAKACPRYAGRIISDLQVDSPSPPWLLERLQNAGIRSINPVVDVTNYVMLELGQPMHAFDNDRLEGDIHVRFARQDEQLTLLDERQCALEDDVLVIADDRQPLAMAGIMGGLESAVSDQTRHIFLESAWFEPRACSVIARRYGLHTDSSHRFERGVDYTLQELAMERATELILAICGGAAGPLSAVEIPAALPVRAAIQLRHAAIERLLGLSIAAPAVTAILQSLDMAVSETTEGWLVTPPPRRFDIQLEVDLIEELARIHGYDRIPPQKLRADLELQPLNRPQSVLEKLRQQLVERGYHEAITYSFVDAALQQHLHPDADPVALANPISAELAVMRNSLWPGLLSALQYNCKRQQPRVRLFETGRVFRKAAGELSQEPVIGGVIYGNIYKKQWDREDYKCDLFAVKGDVEALLLTIGLPGAALAFKPAQHAALHPGQSVEISYNNQIVGLFGALHPEVQAVLELAQPAYLFQLELTLISPQMSTSYQKISKYPWTKRDIAIVVDESLPVAAVEKCIRRNATNYLTNLELFDVYQGEGIDLGKKSLALGLTFQGSSSTLTDEEVEAIMGDVLAGLGSELGGTLRE